MNKNTKSGFLMLEATIFLPIFIIAILTIGYLIKVFAIEDKCMHSMVDESRKLSMVSYNIKVAPTFEMTLKERLNDENPRIDDLSIEKFRYLYRSSGVDNLISLQVKYSADIKLPIGLYDGFERNHSLLFRGFVGIERVPEEVSYEEMEEEKESCIVWLFPVAGEKYHQVDCSYIQVASKEKVLDNRVRRQYSPCTLCKPEALSNGNIVYCFDKTGKAYHSGSCYIVDRYVISMEKEDAIKKGYGPCSKCGG